MAIDKSKENLRIANLMAMGDDVKTKILIGIDNPAILKQFIDSNELEWEYAVAAGLLDWDDVEWIKNNDSQDDDDDDDTWPKLIHFIPGQNGMVLADDSSFSSISKAYDFIMNNWNEGEDIKPEFITFKWSDLVIDTDGVISVSNSWIRWIAYDTIFFLERDKVYSVDDN